MNNFQLTLNELLDSSTRKACGNARIKYEDISLSYKDFYRRVCKVASFILSKGVDSGDVVAVMEWDSTYYLELLFAIPMIGATIQTINVRLSKEQILYTLNDSGAKLLIYNIEFIDIAKNAEKIIRPSSMFEISHRAIKTNNNYLAIVEDSDELLSFPVVNENKVATLFHTTGTTGLPKGVTFTHRNLVLHTLSSLTQLGAITEKFKLSDVYMPMTPIFHVHAWGMPFAATLLGVNQIYPGKYTPEKLVSLIKKENVSFSHCVPTILKMLINETKKTGIDLKGIKILVGGSALTKELYFDAIETGIDAFTGYGMSETGPILSIATNRGHQLNNLYQLDAGEALPFVEIKIMNDEKSDIGEIVVRSPWLTNGYLGSATCRLWESNFLKTGDIGRINHNGSLEIKDRIKDVIKSGGEWISSIELESIITKIEHISECAVIAIPDPTWGERPFVYVVSDKYPCKEKLLIEINTKIRDIAEKGTISRYAKVSGVSIIKELPKTSVGKIDKKSLRSFYNAKQRNTNN